MGHRDPVEIKRELNKAANNANSRDLDELPASVQADLMPELNSQASNEYTSSSLKRFRVQASGVEAKAFFGGMMDGTEYSAVIHPDVSGQITVNLSDVTLDEVFDVVEDMYGYNIIKNGKIVQIYPAGMRTETLAVDYLQLKRAGSSLMSITTSTLTEDNGSSSGSSSSDNSSGSSSMKTGGTEIQTVSESDFWAQLKVALIGLIGEEAGRSVTVNPQAGLVTVRALPDEIREIRQFLDTSHQRLQRQVILEAKILEVTLNDGYQQGINWSSLSKSIGSGLIEISKVAADVATTTLPGQDAIGELLGGQTNITISDGDPNNPQPGDFGAVLSFMATQGDLNVLSSPRITAANNQKAVIKVGVDEYFVTGVSIDDQIISDGNGNTVIQPRTTYDITPFFSGISLDVTPQIDDSGNVMLHVHPAVIDVTGEAAEFLGGAPLARSSIRESDSIIRARDGDVVVIGGLMKSHKLDRVSKVPFLGDIPGLGHLFRNTSQYSQKSELVILLRPTVVGVHTWQKEVERSRDLLQEWFPDTE